MNEPDLQDSLAAVANPPVYSGDVMVDHLYDMVLRLTQELAVTREELTAIKQILREGNYLGEVREAAITQSQDFAGQQLAAHGELVKRIIGDLPQT